MTKQGLGKEVLMAYILNKLNLYFLLDPRKEILKCNLIAYKLFDLKWKFVMISLCAQFSQKT